MNNGSTTRDVVSLLTVLLAAIIMSSSLPTVDTTPLAGSGGEIIDAGSQATEMDDITMDNMEANGMSDQ